MSETAKKLEELFNKTKINDIQNLDENNNIKNLDEIIEGMDELGIILQEDTDLYTAELKNKLIPAQNELLKDLKTFKQNQLDIQDEGRTAENKIIEHLLSEIIKTDFLTLVEIVISHKMQGKLYKDRKGE